MCIYFQPVDCQTMTEPSKPLPTQPASRPAGRHRRQLQDYTAGRDTDTIEQRLRRRMSLLWNVSEHWVHARCGVTDWPDAAETPPLSVLNLARDLFNMTVTSIDYVGTSRCVANLPPPPIAPSAPPAPPSVPPAPPLTPPRPPLLPPGFAGIGLGNQNAPPSAPPGECPLGFRYCATVQDCNATQVGGCVRCPPGTYCRLGILYDCPVDTYSPMHELYERTGCLQCPAHSSSPPAPACTAPLPALAVTRRVRGRREKNRASAQQSRQRKKCHLETLETRVQQLE